MFEWSDQLKLAKELVQRDDEVALRTVAYQKSNHQATCLLKGGRGSKPNFVRRGHYLRELRNRASYDLDFPEDTVLKLEAQKAIKDAESMLAGL